jgi:chromate transporter
VLPGALLIWVISCVYVYFGKLPWIEAVFDGLKAAVMAVVVIATMRIGKKVLKHPAMWMISAASFVAIFFFGVPFPWIVIAGLLIGLVFGKRYPKVFDVAGGHHGSAADDSGTYVISDRDSAVIPSPTFLRTAGTALFWLVVWLIPPVVCIAVFGSGHILADAGLFFSKAAMVTFGGAYAVLPYVAQQAVEVHGWLSPAQMMDGLGLAETTPGPLILVLQFVGFLGGWNSPEGMPPILAATLAAALTTWCTFIPGYLFIFAGAPFVESSRGNLRFNRALSAMTAAVVGVIANLSVWFGWHVVFPAPGRFDVLPLVLAAVFLFLMVRRGWGVIPIVGMAAGIGLVLHFAGIR